MRIFIVFDYTSVNASVCRVDLKSTIVALRAAVTITCTSEIQLNVELLPITYYILRKSLLKGLVSTIRLM